MTKAPNTKSREPKLVIAPTMPAANTLLDRDMSWLAFNFRVLQEAKDASVPLLERIKFLAIYSSNLDEFYKVRVASLRNLIYVSKKTKKELDYDPIALLQSIHETVNRQQREFNRIFEEELLPAFQKHNIRLLRRLDLDGEQLAFVEAYFQSHLLPFVQPVLLIKNKIRIFLTNASLYLAIRMASKDRRTGPEEYAIVKIPSDYVARFVVLPSENGHHDLIMLDDIIRHSVAWMFPGYRIIETYSIKLTRDAELYIEDEFSGDLIAKIKSSLLKRSVGPASRFVYDRDMPPELFSFLLEMFEINPLDAIPEGRYHNNYDFFKFPDFELDQLKHKKLPALPLKELQNMPNLLDKIRERDHLVHVPYHSYESVIQFFERAAIDPRVTHIKLVQYRVAKKSRIMNALMDAVRLGKQVTVFIEVKARFDEEANLHWGEQLIEAGVHVHYSFPGVKVHAKLAMVRRMEEGQPILYAYLGTGNFNEDTARVYSDLGIFTADRRLTTEMARVFSFLETNKRPESAFEHLLVGQFNLRGGLEKLIDREIAHAKAGKPASIIIKANSLQDPEMIQRLYNASQAGVNIKLIIRGICCLTAGKEGLSENIHAISIVDRYLEHARIFIFHNDGQDDIYLSSADMMTRNLSFRVEVAFPIYDPEIRRIILDIIQIQLSDNTKARLIHHSRNNQYRRIEGDLAIRSQLESYYYFKRLNEQEMIDSAQEG